MISYISATVHTARLPPSLLDEVAEESRARRKRRVVDVAVQGLVHSETSFGHTRLPFLTRYIRASPTAFRESVAGRIGCFHIAIGSGRAGGTPGHAPARRVSVGERGGLTGFSMSPAAGAVGCVDMLGTCTYAEHMSVMIQIRNVPEALHRKLKVRAAEAGMSLSDYLLADLRKAAERPTPNELRERLRSRPAVDLREPAARAVRAERDARGAVDRPRRLGDGRAVARNRAGCRRRRADLRPRRDLARAGAARSRGRPGLAALRARETAR